MTADELKESMTTCTPIHNARCGKAYRLEVPLGALDKGERWRIRRCGTAPKNRFFSPLKISERSKNVRAFFLVEGIDCFVPFHKQWEKSIM